MTKHYCDRCKREMKSYSIMRLISHRQSIITLDSIDYDICEDCYYDFKKWLKKGDNSENK